MPDKSRVSKAAAAGFAVLSVSVIAGIVTMALLYKAQIDRLHPTPRPTFRPTTEGPRRDLRLPRNLVPETYVVFVQPRFYTRIAEEANATSPNQTRLFTGNSTVLFRCAEDTRYVYLHSRGLNLSGTAVTDEDAGRRIPVVHLEEQEDLNHRLEVLLGEPLKEGGNYSLFLEFQGQMSEGMKGLFLNTYKEGASEDEDKEDEDKEDASKKRYAAATDMEGRHARAVFPCFDEPDMKAVFRLTVVHRRDTVALGNSAAQVSNIIDEDWKFTRFSPTPRMSTYLFAFTVSEFSKAAPEEPETGGVAINLYARPEAIAKGHGKYAASITGKILRFFEKRFGVDYELKKLDQIALPDLAPAGMENWGLITYHEGSLLLEEGKYSLLQKEGVAITVAHELAHQWFGNLVTMKWWNELWLKEGFATYQSYFAVEHADPSFKMKDAFVLDDLFGAFQRDALTSALPLSPPAGDVQTYGEMEEMYSTISYSKGAVVLRMLADYMGESAFDEGVRMFLKAFQKQSVDQNDLWESMQKAHGSDVIAISKLMDPWVNQNGYPVVTINTTTGEVYQKQFLFNDTAESSRWWQIPIRFMSNTSDDTSLLLLDVSGPVMKEEFISKSGAWILANVNCAGFYRVNYNQENWDRLLAQLEADRSRIPVTNRAQLIDNAFNLARAQLVDVTLALKSTRFLRAEREYLPWNVALINLRYLVHMFDRSEVYGPMQEYLRGQVKDLYNFFRNETDNSTAPVDHASQHNQVIAVEVACSFGLPECVDMARDKYARWMRSNGTNDIHPNLRSAIYCQAIAEGGKQEWEFAWDKYRSATDASEKEQLLEALACTRKVWLLNRYLGYTLDSEKIRKTDVASVFASVSKRPAGQALAWNFLRAHWSYFKELESYYMISVVTSRFSSQFELEELERFASDNESDMLGGAVEQAVEQTRVNIRWVAENRDAVLRWFQDETAAAA